MTDQSVVTLPCCADQLVAEAGGRIVSRIVSLKIEPAAEVATPAVFRIQAAALKDESQAKGLAQQLSQSLGDSADVVFDAGSDMYRVRLGQFQSREAAEQAQRRLELGGLSRSWIVSEKGELAKAEIKISQGGKSLSMPGRWLKLSSQSGQGIGIGGGRYRGQILIYLNDRGLLNVINELSIEDYLRGVVPKEMGPVIYDRLEALKAQTVAARTYTLRNLGEFSDEGYDICATPRCQVYGGMDVEHPLSDQAISATAGEVLIYSGELVEALYSSTCGGHTEDAHIVFPLKNQPYLKGVACLEAGVDRVSGQVPKGVAFPSGLTRELLPPTSPDFNAFTVGGRFEHLALLSGLPVPDDRLASLERREVQRFIASMFDLALDVRLFVSQEDLPYLIAEPPPDWSERDLMLAAYLMKSGLLEGDLDEPLHVDEIEETLFRLALFLRVLEEVEGRYMSLDDAVLTIRDTNGDIVEIPVPASIGTYRLVGDRRVAASLALLAGDEIELYLHSNHLAAITHGADSNGVAFDRTSKRSSWTRFRSDAELTKLVDERYPGLGFRGLEILERGVSGRVGRMVLVGNEGQAVEVEGLAVRWTLDLPDTWFTAKRLTPPDRAPGWLFTGRGWGHGVGMCQVGAFGMAQRGHDYREILSHYYSGVEIGETNSQLAVRRTSQR
jgi:stage II sporulation protein D